MSRFLALLKRELRSITKEKTIMFAIIVQFFIASFSSIILVGIMAFYDPASIGDNTQVRIRAGIVGDTQSPLLGYLADANVRLRLYPDMAEAEDAFRRGRVDTILVLPETSSGVVDMQLIMPELDARKTVIFMVLDEPLKRYENYLRQSAGIDLRYDGTGGKPHTTYEFLYSLIVPILMLFPALIAGSIVIDTVSEEFENKTFDTLAAAPVSLGQVVSSKITAAVVTAAVQVVMWVGLLRLNDIVIQNAPLVILLGIVIAAAISVLTAVMALYFKDRERTQFVYSIVLVGLIGGSYFLNPSPFGLITRLAAGDPSLGIFQVLLYTIPLAVAGVVFLNVSRRLVLSRR
ncbi:MAG TPA: ABC transporter permease [Dehalococcoidales bacterium]|nr:ABC transporter permease [Dehalococcoidales bacterium]